MDMKMTKEPDVFRAKLTANLDRDTQYDNYQKVTDAGEHRQLGLVEITADTLENLKKRLHAHIDLLE